MVGLGSKNIPGRRTPFNPIVTDRTKVCVVAFAVKKIAHTT